MRRLIVIFTGCALAAGALWMELPLLAAPPAPPTANQPAIEVPNCWIKFIDTVVLAAERPGVIAKVMPVEGDEVRAGQEIVVLRDEVARAQYAIAEKEASDDIEIRYARAAARVAEAAYLSAVEANRTARNAIPKVEVDKLRLDAERGKLQIEKAQHDFELAKLKKGEKSAELNTYRIIAPFDGFVTRVLKMTGQAVQLGDPLVELVNNKRLRIEGYIPPEEARFVKRGMRVEVAQADPANPNKPATDWLTGKIVFVDVAVEPVNQKVRVWAEVENRNHLLQVGLHAQMRILPNAPPDAKTAAAESKKR